ncbi:MAG TPA: hypothetical protein VGG61_16565, partial [Gemmataceae bacterium]
TGKPLRFHWGNLTGYPAPAWNLEAPDWSSLTPVPEHVMRAWIWSEQDPKPAASLVRDMNKPYSSDFQTPLRFDNQEVQIESVTFEDEERLVEVEADKQAKRKCLVIRARHTAKHPVLIKLGGNVKPAGAEHHFYDEAGKCTAIFWGVELDQVNNGNFSLDVISIDAIKKPELLVEMKQKGPDSRQRPNPP